MNKPFLLLFVITSFLITASCTKEKSNQPATAASTPAEFVEQASFTTLDGDSVHISDFEGKVVLIDFWETWCKPCLASFPGLDSLKMQYPNRFEVLAVTPGFSDTRANAKAFAENHDYSFTYLMDSNRLHEKLNIFGIPYKIYVSADGEFIDSSMGSAGARGDYQKMKEILENQLSAPADSTQ